jgi:hypothetical protein
MAAWVSVMNTMLLILVLGAMLLALGIDLVVALAWLCRRWR